MNIDPKPAISAAITFWLFSTILGVALFFTWQFFIPNYTQLYVGLAFRPFEDPLTLGLYFVPLAEGIIYAVFYGALKKIIPCNTAFQRGSTYGLFLFLVSSFPFLLLNYFLFSIPALLVAAWGIEMVFRQYFGCGAMAVIYERAKLEY